MSRFDPVSDTGLMPRLSWAPVTGATIYRVDIAADPQLNSIVESQLTESTSWTPRAPLRDNQIGTGYWWRIVWGNGFTTDSPGWMVDEDLVAKDQFRKQTRVTLGQPANGGVVADGSGYSYVGLVPAAAALVVLALVRRIPKPA